MDGHEPDALRDRVARAETLARAAIAGCALSLVVVVATLVWLARTPAPQAGRPGVAGPDVVRGRFVEVVDRDGVPRITMDAVGGRPGVWLYDAKRQRRLGLGVGDDGAPAVLLIDDRGGVRIGMRVGFDGTPVVGLADSAGRPRIELWVNASREPVVALYDRLARHRVVLKVLADGIGRLWLFDAGGGTFFSAP